MLLSRREFQQATLGSLLTYTLLETLFRSEALGDEVTQVAKQWLGELNTMSQDLKGKKLEQIAWQTKVEERFSKVDLPEFLKFIDFEKLAKSAKFPEHGEQSLRAALPKVEGLPTELVFGHQIFALKKGRSVVPHGHDNMATAFLILQGDFHGRHFDRLEDDKTSMVIKPTIDRPFKPAEYSSISDYKDNVHWFEATSETGFIFNIHVLSVKPGRTGRVYIDPNGEKLSGGRIRAKKIDAQEAHKLYG